MDNEKKQWYKKWWIWAIIAFVLVIGFVSQGEGKTENNNGNNNQQQENLLPSLKTKDYVGKESLLVYHELKDEGYIIELDYALKDNQALYNNNMKLLGTFKDLDPSNEEDRLSVDSYIIDSIIQNGNNVKLVIK